MELYFWNIYKMEILFYVCKLFIFNYFSFLSMCIYESITVQIIKDRRVGKIVIWRISLQVQIRGKRINAWRKSGNLISEAASIPSSRNSSVLWVTEELQSAENNPGQDSNLVDMPISELTRQLLRVLEEMQRYIEIMPADDPNTGNDQRNQGPPCASGASTREELKKQYTDYYLGRIKQFTQWDKYHQSPTKPIDNSTLKTQQVEPLNQIMKKVEERRALPQFEGQRKMVSLYPDCDYPNIWGAGNTIDFSFDLSFSEPSPDIVINVTSAFVRMYKKPLNMSLAEANHISPDRNISFLAVYYKNPLNRKDPSKRGSKLVEHILRADEERWTEWDVKKAIAAGFNNSIRYNGVTIKVADDQIHLPARDFFTLPINCSHITEWPTLTPAILRKSLHDGMRQDLPFIDMVVLELPKRDVKFTEKEEEFLNGVKTMKLQIDEGFTTTQQSEHKIRHRRNKEPESEE